MVVEAVPGVEDEAAGAVFAVFAELAFFEDAEGLVDAAGATDVFGVKDVAELVGCQTVEVSNYGVELCLKHGAAVGVEYEWLFLADIRHFIALFFSKFFP